MPPSAPPPSQLPPSSPPPPPPPSQPPRPLSPLNGLTLEDFAEMDEGLQETVRRILGRAQRFYDRKKGIVHPSSPTHPGVELARRCREAMETGQYPPLREEEWKRSEEELFDTHLNQECIEDESEDLECSSPDRDGADQVKRRRVVTPLPDMTPKMHRSG